MDNFEGPIRLKGFRSLSSFREKERLGKSDGNEEPKLLKNLVISKGQKVDWEANDASIQFRNVNLEQMQDHYENANSCMEPAKTKNLKFRTIFYMQDGSYPSEGLEKPCPSDQFEIIWKDLAYEIEVSRINYIVKNLISSDDGQEKPFVGKRVIFDNLNGYARSGEITAIIGPSGAGKTSLLNAICGFETQNHRGSIQLFGGRHKKHMHLSLIPQKDYLLDNLTVYENLWYSSRILNSNKGFDHEANIDRVVDVLNLTKCVHTRCKDLSGGEYKRVSIAQELLRQPDILVLDEPTSGLDSLNCRKLISTLQDLINRANQGVISPIAIVMTIHQPDVEIYSMFDHVYCLAPGGRVVFDGHPSRTLDVLRTEGGIDVGPEKDSSVENSPQNNDGPMINPANLLIEIALKASPFDADTIDRLAAYQRNQFDQHWRFLDLYQECAASPSMKSCKEKECHRKEIPKVDSQISVGNNNSSSSSSSKYLLRDKRLQSKFNHEGLFWYHAWMLTKRSFLGTIRDPLQSVISFTFHAILGVLMWMIYSKDLGKINGCPELVRDISLLSATDDDIQGRLAIMMDQAKYTFEGTAMFFCATYSLTLVATEIASMTFPMSMHILLKELRNGRYNMSAFVLGKTIANFPVEVGFPAFSMALTYWVCDMPPSYMNWRMIAIAIIMAVVAMIVTTQGLVIGALFMDSPQTAVFLAIAATMPYILLSGFLVRIKSLPKILQYASYFVPYRYSSDLMTIIRYGYGICPCEPETDQYLRTAKYRIVDIPENVNHLFKYYLQNYGTATEAETDSKDVFVPVPGINYDLVMNSTDQSEALERFDSEMSDPFEPLAKLISRLFSYGRPIDSCQSHRNFVLTVAGMPPDDWAPYLFGLLVALFFMWRFILYFVVWHKIGSRM